FVVTVEDNAGGQASTTVTVVVEAVNDAPAISGTPAATAIEGVAYSFAPVVTDPEGDAISYSIDALPSWASFDGGTGAFDGTPATADVGLYEDISITVSDGVAERTLTFDIEVLADLDGDAIADINDDDVDGDGISNDYETAAGLDPRDDGDALSDLDGDGVSNLDEFLAGSDASEDDYPPVATTPGVVSVDASGLYTRVDLGEAFAVDVLDGNRVLLPRYVYLVPGAHAVERVATDRAGGAVTVAQEVKGRPQVSFGPDQVSAEGATVTVTVYLNGPAAEYPVTVPFSVAGTAQVDGSDHDLVDDTLVINSGTEAQFSFDLVDDGANEATETVEITMGTIANAIPGLRTTHRVAVREDNVGPRVRLQASQGGQLVRSVVASGGVVEVSTIASDVKGDGVTFDWSGTDAELVDADGQPDTFTFDPAELAAGVYQVSVRADDGVEQGASSLLLKVVSSAPVLGVDDSDGDGVLDLIEGAGDSDNDG